MKLSRRIALSGAVAAATIAATLLSAAPALASTGEMTMYRLYNPYSGEHFYTASELERNMISSVGWVFEGIGWVAPESSRTPVYRLYNRYADDHHYTMSEAERDALVEVGWSYEGIGWYSDDERRVPMLRQYNPYAVTGTHNYTASQHENDVLVELGWRAEGVAWYAVAEGSAPVASTAAPIMARTFSTPDAMARCFNASGRTFPAGVYASKGATTIEDFCHILVEEAADEGVSGDVVFAQAMLETGYLSFTGAVRPEMCNFCGLGANSSVPGSGNTFANVREGLRAQVQHLKAYGSRESLVHDLVDPRFGYVTRGCAPTIGDLSGRWAGEGYGEKIASVLERLYQF